MFNFLLPRNLFTIIPLVLSIALSLGGCNNGEASKTETDYVARRLTYTKAERINEVSRIIQERIPLPSPLLDAYFDEDRKQDEMGLGPTDFTSYMYVKVAPKDIEKWNVILKEKINYAFEPTTPDRKYPWWVDPQRFRSLEFYEPFPLSPLRGWIGVSRTTGEIWIVGYTS